MKRSPIYAVAVVVTVFMLLISRGQWLVATAKTMPFEITSESGILIDQNTGDVLLAKNEDKKLYPASVTKIMTLLLVAEAIDTGRISFDTEVVASATACEKGGSQIWLKEGEVMTVDELLRATFIGSANDACTALAETVAVSEAAFVTMMNDRARELGMKNTYFENCTGLDDTAAEHLTTAKDIALMSRELLSHEWIIRYSTVWMDTLRDGKTELTNTNRLVRFYEGATGLKTGTTNKAGSCLAASARRDGTHLVAVVMGAPTSKDRFEDAKALLNYGFANYKTVKLAVDESLIAPVNVKFAASERVMPKIPRAVSVLVPTSAADSIKQKVTLAVSTHAPIEASQSLGKVEFFAGNELVATVNLLAPEKIPRLGFFDSLKLLLGSLTK